MGWGFKFLLGNDDDKIHYNWLKQRLIEFGTPSGLHHNHLTKDNVSGFTLHTCLTMCLEFEGVNQTTCDAFKAQLHFFSIVMGICSQTYLVWHPCMNGNPHFAWMDLFIADVVGNDGRKVGSIDRADIEYSIYGLSNEEVAKCFEEL